MMRVRALRTVYYKADGKEYQKGQSFEVTERDSRALVKLRKVELVDQQAATAAPKGPRQQPAPRTLTTTAMKAEDDAAVNESGVESPRRYRRRDLLPEE